MRQGEVSSNVLNAEEIYPEHEEEGENRTRARVEGGKLAGAT